MWRCSRRAPVTTSRGEMNIRRVSSSSTACVCAGFPSTTSATWARSADGRSIVFDRPHSYLDELKWLDAEGPKSTPLLSHVRSADAAYDYVFFFSYRYYHAYHGVRAVPSRAILVPTAERDRGHRPGHFAAHFPRRARAHVQQPRRAAADSGRLEQSRRAWRRRGHRLRDSRTAARPNGSDRSTGSPGASRCTSGASIRTRAATNCSRSS